MSPEQEQKKLGQDYADYLVEYEAAKAQGRAIGTFIEWQHLNNRVGIKITKRGEDALGGYASS